MIPFTQYPDFYPDLISEMLLFFYNVTIENGTIINTAQTVMDFCEFYNKKHNPGEYPQPVIIAKICEVLAENHVLTRAKTGSFIDRDQYLFSPFNSAKYIEDLNSPQFKDAVNIAYNCLVFGFSFINKYAHNKVNPLLHISPKLDQSIGTTFNYHYGIATAKHCIDGAKKIAIKNVSKEALADSKFFVHKKEEIDLLYIKLKQDADNFTHSFFRSSTGEVLDKVIAIGFPNVPGFHSFQTCEEATISSRYTPSIGSIAAIAEDFWMKENMMLITAKISGGNSGGPILNSKGEVVGISSNLPLGEGDYDNLGYGAAIPIELLDSMLEGNYKEYDKSGIEFVDFPS